MGELIHRHARRDQCVDFVALVGIAQSHAAHHHLTLARTNVRQDDAVKTIPSSLRASMQTTRTRSEHDVLHKHAVVKQRATP